jgi:hypothetical protein
MRASGLVFMLCAPGPVLGGADGVGSCFHILRSRTRFRQYRGRQIPFSCFAPSVSFSAVPRALGSVFMFCALGLVFGGSVGVGPVFMFCAPGHVFGDTKGVGSNFHVLRSRTHFQRYRRRRVPFSYFALSDSFWAIPRASCPFVILRAVRLVFGGTEEAGSSFRILRWTRFGRYRGHHVPISCLALLKSFSTVPRAPVPFSYFALPDSFWAVSWVPILIFIFRAHDPVLAGTDVVESRFHILRSRTRFQRHLGCSVSFSCFALSDSF